MSIDANTTELHPAGPATPHKITGPWGNTVLRQHGMPNFRTAILLFRDGAAFVTDPDLIDTYRALSDRYRVEPVDQVPTGYRAAAELAHGNDSRVLVPAAVIR
jgi:hypothetical protein